MITPLLGTRIHLKDPDWEEIHARLQPRRRDSLQAEFARVLPDVLNRDPKVVVPLRDLYVPTVGRITRAWLDVLLAKPRTARVTELAKCLSNFYGPKEGWLVAETGVLGDGEVKIVPLVGCR